MSLTLDVGPMVFEIPDNLHPNCGPVAWLLGTWRGNGHGDYPTIEGFEFGQELIFTHDGRPFFHYMARAWIVDAEGENVRDAAMESGFLRCPEPRQGRAAAGAQHRLRRGLVRRSGGRQARAAHRRRGLHRDRQGSERGGKRLYGNVEGDLLYAYDMAAMGQALQPHTWARLKRA